MQVKETIRHMTSHELVAVDNNPWKSANRFPTDAVSAEVIAVRQPRKVNVRGQYRQQTVNDGVQVRYEDGTTAIVGPRDIVTTWIKYQDVLKAREERAQKEREVAQRISEIDVVNKQRAEWIATVLEASVVNDGSGVYSIKLNIDKAEMWANLALEHDEAQASQEVH